MEFNLTRICDRAPRLSSTRGGAGSNACPFVSVTNHDVNRYFSAGPPYVLHVEDVVPFSKRWSELVSPTYDEYPLLYAEMFAYSMAAADLDLRHNLVRGLFAGCMTHWPVVGARETASLEAAARDYANSVGSDNATDRTDERREGGASSCFPPPLSPPPFLHYCSRYSFATPYPPDDGTNNAKATPKYHFFAKRRVDHDVLSCGRDDRRPLTPFGSPKKEKMEGGQKDWNVLAVCAAVRAINLAKERGCGAFAR